MSWLVEGKHDLRHSLKESHLRQGVCGAGPLVMSDEDPPWCDVCEASWPPKKVPHYRKPRHDCPDCGREHIIKEKA